MSNLGGWDRKKAEKLWRETTLTGDQIAMEVGAPSRSAIIGWMNRNGVERAGGPSKPTPWTDEKAELAAKLWLEGRTARQIAEELGPEFTNKAVINRMQRDGVACPPRTSAPKSPKAPTIYSWGKGSAAQTKAPDLEAVRKAEAAPVDPATLKTFAELDRQQCLWPVGGPDPVRGQLFCGQPTAFRKSYCACHGGPQSAPRRPWRVKDLGLAAERPRSRSSAAESDVVDLVEVFR